MTVQHLALLVLAHLLHGGLVQVRVFLHRDVRRHAAYGVHAAPVTGAYHQA